MRECLCSLYHEHQTRSLLSSTNNQVHNPEPKKYTNARITPCIADRCSLRHLLHLDTTHPPALPPPPPPHQIQQSLNIFLTSNHHLNLLFYQHPGWVGGVGGYRGGKNATPHPPQGLFWTLKSKIPMGEFALRASLPPPTPFSPPPPRGTPPPPFLLPLIPPP